MDAFFAYWYGIEAYLTIVLFLGYITQLRMQLLTQPKHCPRYGRLTKITIGPGLMVMTKQFNILLIYLKGHGDIPGNCKADKLARIIALSGNVPENYEFIDG